MMSKKANKGYASEAATAKAGAFILSLKGKVDADALIKLGNQPGHALYEFVQAYPMSERYRLAATFNRWAYDFSYKNSCAVRDARNVKWLLKWVFEPRQTRYAVLQRLVDETLEKGTGKFFLSKVQIGEDTGIKPSVVTLVARDLEDCGYLVCNADYFTVTSGKKTAGVVNIEEAAVTNKAKAPSHWDIDFGRILADLLDRLTPEARKLLGIPESWRGVRPESLHAALTRRAFIYQDKEAYNPFGKRPVPLGYGTGVNRQVWELLRIEKGFRPKTLHTVLGMPSKSAYRAYSAAIELFQEIPEKVQRKADAIKKAAKKLREKAEAYFLTLPKNDKAKYRPAAEVLGELKERYSGPIHRVAPSSGPPRGWAIER